MAGTETMSDAKLTRSAHVGLRKRDTLNRHQAAAAITAGQGMGPEGLAGPNTLQHQPAQDRDEVAQGG